MNIEGENIVVQKSAEELYTFFTQLKNFEQLMPDSTQKFEVDNNQDSFLFALKGMPEIRLVLKESTEFSNVTLGSASDKFPFTLAANINELENNKSEVQLLFNGKFNAMMAMMIKNPLTNFINTLSDNIKKL